MSSSALFHRYSEPLNFTEAGEGLIISQGQFSPAYFILEGLDLVNNPVTEGSYAQVLVDNAGTGGSAGDMFQAFVYATSQGSFSWRGNAVIFPTQSVSMVVGSGEWSVFAWGHSEPAYGSFT